MLYAYISIRIGLICSVFSNDLFPLYLYSDVTAEGPVLSVWPVTLSIVSWIAGGIIFQDLFVC